MAANPETAVTVVEQDAEAVVEWNLDAWPADQFNRLIPTQTLGLGTDLIRPVVQVVTLDEPGDTYRSNDLPDGHEAPTAKGLKKLMGPAGIDHVDSVRVDDGSNPQRASVKVYVEMVDATGRRRRATGSRDYDLSAQKMTDKQRERARSHVFENAETRALNRAIRALLSLAQSYPAEQIHKPFAVVSFVPNMQHPDVRRTFLEGLTPAIASSYGPDTKQLGSGVIEVPEVVDGEATEVAPAPTQLPGEQLAKAAPAGIEEPSWMQEAAPAAAAQPSFADRIRDSATEPGSPRGAASAALKANLGEKLRDAGLGGREFSAGFVALWPGADVEKITAAQARAIVLAAESDEGFAAHWRELAGQAGSAAA